MAITERLLAGYTLDKPQPVAIHDSATGSYFIRTGDCDGAHRRLILSISKVTLPGDIGTLADKPISSVRLSSQQTGRGIALGHTQAQVARRMGRPTWQGGSLFHRQEEVWSYRRIYGRVGERKEEKTLFRFRQGRVTCIELYRDELDSGC